MTTLQAMRRSFKLKEVNSIEKMEDLQGQGDLGGDDAHLHQMPP